MPIIDLYRSTRIFIQTFCKHSLNKFQQMFAMSLRDALFPRLVILSYIARELEVSAANGAIRDILLEKHDSRCSVNATDMS